jgi:glycosyltransferase involved in cell wall biosynthesis
MGKVLMITYQFPPDNGSIQRVLNYVKYLPDNGWTPIILTHKAEKSKCEFIDSEFLNRGIDVQRTGMPLNFSESIVEKINQAEVNYAKVSRNSWFKISLLRKTKKFLKLVSNLVVFPDPFVWWIPFALLRAVKIIRKEEIGAVYIVTPPHSASIIGFCLSKIFTVKVVTDFRDPWANDIDIIMPTALHRSCHRITERLVSRSSNAIITTTNFHSNYFKESVLHNSSSKVHTITNGFDLLNFNPNYLDQNDLFTITYAGNFDLTRTPTSFLKAVSNVNSKYPEIFKTHSVKFFGNFNSNVEEEINALGLSEIVKQYGLIEYESVIDEISNASLLLLIVHNDSNTPKFCIPAKLFEYMATGRPILAISPPGEATEIIARFNLGESFDHADIKGIEQGIIESYELFETGNLQTRPLDPEILKKYDRNELTKDLAQILNNLNQ